jgi:hypothetical protein
MHAITIQLADETSQFIDEQVALGGFTGPTDYIASLIEEARRRNAYQELRELLLAGVRSPAVELTPEVWQEMRREADAALRARAAS